MKHLHHIIPRHMGGTDDPSNLEYITVEEHVERHRELYNNYGKIEDLWASQLLSHQITYKEGFKMLLTKNAYDTHRKQKEKRTGLYDSNLQSIKGKKAAIASKLGQKENSPNYIRLCCLICKRETTLPTFYGHHLKKCH